MRRPRGRESPRTSSSPSRCCITSPMSTAGESPGGSRAAHSLADCRRRRAATDQLSLQRSASTVVQAMDRAFRTAGAGSDLEWREPGEVAQHEHLALIARQFRERLAQVAHPPIAGRVADAMIGDPYLFHGHQPLTPQVINGDVASHPQYPREERHLSFLVFVDHANQLCEYLLGHVFGLV